MNFNEKLQIIRKGKGITQEALAEKLEVTRQTISKWECGESTPDFQNLVKLSEIFEVSTDFLLKDNVNKEEKKDDNKEKNKETAQENESSQYKSLEIRYVKSGIDKKSLLGACLFGVGAIVVIVLFILSVAYPATAIIGSLIYEGLFGFLIYEEAIWVFVLACIMLAAGFALLIIPFFRKEK